MTAPPARSTAALAALLFALLVALHALLLRLPYYWDEAGYFIPAALDCFRHGWLIPRSTLANGHVPLLSVYLAAVWHLFGFHPLVTRTAMLGWGALLLAGVFRLGQALADTPTAAVATLLFGVSPLFFAQASLAQLDVAVAALIVWGLVFRARGQWAASAAALALACCVKETAVLAPLALLAYDLASLRRRHAWWTALPALAVVGAWFAYYHHVTGYWFGNPEYFAYNVGEAAFSPGRILLSFGHRIWQLAGYNGTWLLTALALWSALWPGLRRGPALPRRRWAPLAVVIAASLAFHALVGGAVLARYLLPALALYFLWLARQLLRLPRAPLWVGACAAFLIVNWFWNPPYPFPFEDNLAYASFIRLHEAAADQLAASGRGVLIATAWPATDELRNPDLGYVVRPLPVEELAFFNAPALVRAAARPAAPQLLYLFSREYQPRADLTRLLPGWRPLTDRYFHHSPPLPEARWSALWNLRPQFRQARAGQWVAIYAAGDRDASSHHH